MQVKNEKFARLPQCKVEKQCKVENLYSQEEAEELNLFFDWDSQMWLDKGFQWEFFATEDIRKIHNFLESKGTLYHPGYRMPEYTPEPTVDPEPTTEVTEDLRDEFEVLCGIDRRTKEQAWKESQEVPKQEIDPTKLAMLLKRVIKDIVEIEKILKVL